LSDFARRDTGGPKVVSLQEILEAALNLAANSLKHRVQIVREYGDIPPVLGLTSELTELFVHLLINAAQALEEEPGTVTVSMSGERGMWWSASVTPAAAFHPRTCLGSSIRSLPARRLGSGTGMGLAVCYGMHRFSADCSSAS